MNTITVKVEGLSDPRATPQPTTPPLGTPGAPGFTPRPASPSPSIPATPPLGTPGAPGFTPRPVVPDPVAENKAREQKEAQEKYWRDKRRKAEREETNRARDGTPEEEAADNLKRRDRQRQVAEVENRLNPPEAKFAPAPKARTVRPVPTVHPVNEPSSAAVAQKAVGQAAGAAGQGEVAALMGAAGPAGIAVAAFMLLKKVVDEVKEFFGDIARLPARVSEAISGPAIKAAGGQNAKALTDVAESFIEFNKKVPIVGEAFGAVADSAMRVGKAFTGVVDAFVDRGREISAYSGGLAESYAVADVRQLMADIKEAQHLDAAGLSRLNDAQTDLSIMLRDLLLPVKEMIVNNLAALLEDLVKWAKRNQDELVLVRTAITELVKLTFELATFNISGAAERLVKLKSVITAAIKESHDISSVEADIFQIWRKNLDDLGERDFREHNPLDPNLNAIGQDQRLAVPILGGV